jgi:hypothetical protein
MKNINEQINVAAEFIGAKQISKSSYYFYASETGRHYKITTEELCRLAKLMDMMDNYADAYSHWCAMYPGWPFFPPEDEPE